MALGYMRRHRRWLYIFLWLVIAAFIILYIPAFQGGTGGAEIVGTVGKLPITAAEFQRDYLRVRENYQRMYQGRLTPDAIKSLGLDEQVFSSLVVTRLVELESKRLGLHVDDDSVAERLMSLPQFQRDGRFIGGGEIRRLLDLRGTTVEEFEEGIRDSMLREKLESLVTSGVTVTDAEAEREYRRQNEKIKAEYVLIDADKLRSGAKASDDEVEARFKAAREAYRIPEKRVLDYLLLDAAALQSQVSVTESEISNYYDVNEEQFRQPEQVCARHILIKVKSGPDSPQGHSDAEAKQIAERLLAKLRAGADFAELAESASEDEGSASRGGDLGCFTRGRMVPQFEKAAFELAPGATSGLVKTSFGYHIIHVDSKQAEALAPLAQVQDRIRQILKGQKVTELMETKAAAVAGALASGKSLEEAAKAQGLSVQKSAPIARGKAAPPLASPSLVARAFQMKQGETAKEPFQLPRGYAFFRVAEIQPSRLPQLAEVKQQVQDDIERDQAIQRARALAVEVKTVAESRGLEAAAKAKGLVRKETPSPVSRGQAIGDLGASESLDAAVYALPEKTLSEPLRVASGWAIVRVLEKTPFDPAAFQKQKQQLIATLRNQKRNELFQAYMENLRQRFPVQRRPEVFRRLVS